MPKSLLLCTLICLSPSALWVSNVNWNNSYESLTYFSFLEIFPSHNFFNTTWYFESWLCFRLQARKVPDLVNPLNTAIVTHWAIQNSYIEGVHQMRWSSCLKAKAQPASETSRFTKKIKTMDKVHKKKIMSVSHIPLSEPQRVEFIRLFNTV